MVCRFSYRYLQPDHNLLSFFGQFDRVVETRREKEEEMDFKDRNAALESRPFYNELLRNAASIYTSSMYDLLQSEHDKAGTLQMRAVDLNGDEWGIVNSSHYQVWVVAPNPAREYDVMLDRPSQSITCSCKKFENSGVFCCHCIFIMNFLNAFDQPAYTVIPWKYIMKRWTRRAKDGLQVDLLNAVGDNDGRGFMQRYRAVCGSIMKFALNVSKDENIHESFMKDFESLKNKYSNPIVGPIGIEHVETEFTIMKKTNTGKGRARLKSISKTERTKAAKRLRKSDSKGNNKTAPLQEADLISTVGEHNDDFV